MSKYLKWKVQAILDWEALLFLLERLNHLFSYFNFLASRRNKHVVLNQTMIGRLLDEK